MSSEDKRREQEHSAAIRFRRADRALKRCIEYRVKDTGVYRSQHRLLMELYRRPNCSQIELAELLEVSPAAVAVSLKKLEKGGYIQKKTAVDDGRANQVEITALGNEVIKMSFRMFGEIDKALFADFSDEELYQITAFFERMIANLEKVNME